MSIIDILSKNKILYIKYIGIAIVVIFLLTSLYGLYNGISSLFIENKDKSIGKQEIIIDDLVNVNKKLSSDIAINNELTEITYNIIYDVLKDKDKIAKKKEVITKKRKVYTKIYSIQKVIPEPPNKMLDKNITVNNDIVVVEVNITKYEYNGNITARSINDMLHYVREYK